MIQQWYDVVYSFIEMGQEMEKYSEDHFNMHLGHYLEYNGLSTHYLEDGEGPHTLIFLHGIMMNSNIWESYLQRFSLYGQVYALDFLGHGLSTKKPDLTLEDLILQLDTFIEKKKLKNPILIGHSLGGMVGAIYASRYPKKVKQLISISTVDYDTFIGDFKTMFNSNFVNLLEGILNPLTSLMFMESLMEQVYNNESFLKPHERDHFLYHTKIKGVKKSSFSLMKNYRLQDFSSDCYKNIQCPTLIIHGTKDKLIGVNNSDALEKAIPYAKLIKVVGGSHMLIHEDKEKVMGFLDEALGIKTKVLENK